MLRPNDLPYCRLGVIVPRRVGNAVSRHHLKRMLREAFRLDRHDYPASYDMVIVVRPHEPLHFEKYHQLLQDAVARGHRVWERRKSST